MSAILGIGPPRRKRKAPLGCATQAGQDALPTNTLVARLVAKSKLLPLAVAALTAESSSSWLLERARSWTIFGLQANRWRSLSPRQAFSQPTTH